MLSHSPSQLMSFPSRDDWYSITLDESFSSVPSSVSPSSRSSPLSHSTLFTVRGLAQRRQQQKLASGEFLAPLTPHLYPRTPFCSPNSSPLPLDASPLSSRLSAVSSSLSAGGGSGSLIAGSVLPHSRRKQVQHPYPLPQQQQPTASAPSHLTVHTATSFSTSSTLSPHSARSHSVPFLPFRYFDEYDCELQLSPDSAVSRPQYCTPFPSPIQPAGMRQQPADLAPPSPLLLTRPSSPQLSSHSLPSSQSMTASSEFLDFSSYLLVPSGLLSNQPPLSPAVVPLTPPSSPLPLSLTAASSSHYSSPSHLSIPSIY